MKKRLLAILLLLSLFAALTSSAFAADDTAINAADTLYSAGLFRGVGTNSDGTVNYDLDRSLNRYEAVVMLIRLLGKENVLPTLSDSLSDEFSMSKSYYDRFNDVASWAKLYVTYANMHSLTNGISNTAFGGQNEVTAAQFLTFICRALGYSEADGDFTWSTAWTLTNKLGITHGEYNKSNNSTFLRSDAVKVSLAALKAQVKYENVTLAERLYKSNAISAESLCSILGISKDALPNKFQISAKYFSVTVPQSWEGKYVYKVCDSEITFYEKESYATGWGGELFTFILSSELQEFEPEYLCAITLPNGTASSIWKTSPTGLAYNYSNTQIKQRYRDMYDDLNQFSIQLINGAKSVDWLTAYAKFYRDNGNDNEYYLYDIDKDGVPELFVYEAKNFSNQYYYLYTYDVKTAQCKLISKFYANRTALCGLDNESAFISDCCLGYTGTATKYIYKNGKLYEDSSIDYEYGLNGSPAPAFEYFTSQSITYAQWYSGQPWSGNAPTYNDEILAGLLS